MVFTLHPDSSNFKVLENQMMKAGRYKEHLIKLKEEYAKSMK